MLTKETLEVLRMPNCFQVGGKSLISILKSLSEIKVVDASDCGQISVKQARDILRNCKQLEFFLFLLAGVRPTFGQTFSVMLSMSNLGIP